MAHKLQQWYARHKLLTWVITGLLLTYTLAGFVAAPLAIHHVLKKKGSQALGRDVQAETVRFNPYTFSLRLTGLSVSGVDGPLVRIGVFYVNVDPLISLFKWGVVVNSVEIRRPKVHIVRGADRRFNFSDLALLSAKTPATENAAPSKPLRLVLNAFVLSDGEILFQDKAQPLPFESTVSALKVALNRMDTMPDAGAAPYHVSARTEAGETLEVEGRVDLDPLTAEADIRLGGMVLGKYRPYYQSMLQAQVSKGVLGLDATVYWAQDRQSIDDILLTLTGLALVSQQGEPLVAIPRLRMEDASVDLKKRAVQLGRISSRSGEIDAQINPAGLLNLQTAFAPQSGEKAASPALEAENGSTPPLPWMVRLPEMALRDYTVRFKDRQTTPAANIPISRINIGVKDLSTQKDQRGTTELTLRWADQGALKVQGSVGLMPLQADLQVAMDGLDLRPLQPYINSHLQLVVTEGYFDTQGAFKIASGDAQMDIQYAGQAAVNKFRSVDKVKAGEFLSWKSLYINGLELGTAPFRLTINEVALTDFFNLLIINPDGTSNLAAIMGRQQEPLEGAQRPAKTPAGESTLKQEKDAARIGINTVTLQGGKVDFRDLYVKPNVRLPMTRIGGRVSGLDAFKEHRADVLLKGMVSGSVPMEIKGQVNPLIEKPYVDLTIALNGVDLSPFTPYSGKYLGYALEKGQLSLDLVYRVADNKLAAQNKVLLSQLTLGESVSSPEATKLPIKLALALLKDRQGNIDLDLPVGGDLNDPEFSIGGIVVKMFVNLIVGIVSSPFKMLGAIFGGGEELAYLDFDYGQSLITVENSGKLDTLAKILYERPGLKLEIQGQINPDEDIAGLRRLRFEEQLRAFKLKTMVAKGVKAIPTDQIKITMEERQRLVQKAFAAAKFPKPRDEKGNLKKLNAEEKEKLLFTAIAVTPGDLRLLAHRRASAAKDYLIDHGKVEAQRLFIVEPESERAASKEELRSRVKFNLT